MVTKKGTTSEKCMDSQAFINWLVIAAQSDPNLLGRLINPNSVRKGSLPPEVRDTFFEKSTTTKPDAVRQASAIPVEVLNG
jgi:hypothetical protein